jgi:SAM-dependent methyltransferase
VGKTVLRDLRPMKIRDSGMPDEKTWESFFDAPLILKRLDFECESEDVVDFGCGYGTFALAAARFTSGTVYALDVEPEMIAATAANAQRSNLSNVKAIARDFVATGSGLRDASVAYAMLLHPTAPGTGHRPGTRDRLQAAGIDYLATAPSLWGGRAQAVTNTLTGSPASRCRLAEHRHRGSAPDGTRR